jgi:hypothetical protein
MSHAAFYWATPHPLLQEELLGSKLFHGLMWACMTPERLCIVLRWVFLASGERLPRSHARRRGPQEWTSTPVGKWFSTTVQWAFTTLHWSSTTLQWASMTLHCVSHYDSPMVLNDFLQRSTVTLHWTSVTRHWTSVTLLITSSTLQWSSTTISSFQWISVTLQ